MSENFDSAKLAVIDCLRDNLSCDEVGFMTVTNERAGVAVFIDNRNWDKVYGEFSIMCEGSLPI